jgi:tripartite-type tricarboxylate transporter receptor subunit TctC
MHRLLLLGLTGLCLLAGEAKQNAHAQANYPQRPVRIVVPSSPGGGTDILARVLADHFAKTTGGQFFVENRPGAGQSIGIEAVARSPPDGYTLLMAASTLALNPVMFKNIRYDPVRDFAPISQVASLPNVLLVHPSLPVATLKDLIALAKQKPGELTYASAGVGTSPHMGVELLKHMAGIDLVHVPFRGTGPAVTEVLGGHIPIVLSNTLTAKSLIESGKLRALAVTGAKRAQGLPDIPTVAEAGVPNYEALQWYGLLAPAGTPPEIVARLHAQTAQALKLQDVKERLASDGAEPVGSTPSDFARFIKDELEKWTNVARTANIKPE